MIEWYRPVDASTVATATQKATACMLTYAKEDLALGPLCLAWFSASPTPLTLDEWLNPILRDLNTHEVEGERTGCVRASDPTTVWCRADLTPRQAARTVAHEVRHAWHFTQEAWKSPAPDYGDADRTIARHHEWRTSRERDSDAYADSQEAIIEAVALSVTSDAGGDGR